MALPRVRRVTPARATEDPQRRLHDCESHLNFLGEALASLPSEPDRYKQLGAELRELVCQKGQHRPLLLDLMDDYGVEYVVEPMPDFPFPITMVEDFLNPPAIDRKGLSINQISERHRPDARPVPLRDFIDDALAVWIRPHAFSYRELILAVAQESGEKEIVEESPPDLEQFVHSGFSGYAAPMRVAAAHAVRAGALLISQASNGAAENSPGTSLTVTASTVTGPRGADWSDERLWMALGLRVLDAVGLLLGRTPGGSVEGPVG